MFGSEGLIKRQLEAARRDTEEIVRAARAFNLPRGQLTTFEQLLVRLQRRIATLIHLDEDIHAQVEKVLRET